MVVRVVVVDGEEVNCDSDDNDNDDDGVGTTIMVDSSCGKDNRFVTTDDVELNILY